MKLLALSIKSPNTSGKPNFLPGSIRVFNHTPKQSRNIGQMTSIELLVCREIPVRQVPLAKVNMIAERSHKTLITERLQRNVVKQING